jgi:hypothetical protein
MIRQRRFEPVIATWKTLVGAFSAARCAGGNYDPAICLNIDLRQPDSFQGGFALSNCWVILRRAVLERAARTI